jgi:uncharacterized surface protein with fasciclin (FAS1) repeats
MTTLTTRKVFAAAACSLALLGVAACGSQTNTAASPSKQSSSAAPSTSSMDTSADLVGPGCADYAKAVPKGAGSVDGMAQDPVATAASNNPLLTTLVAAVTAVPGLADTLNAAPALTVFAPTDDAFKKIPEADLNKVLADQATLTAILSHHVIPEKLDPTAIVGEHDTLNGDKVTVEGDAESGMTVDGGAANVICGNIPTKNATVYVIDSVLMPTK